MYKSILFVFSLFLVFSSNIKAQYTMPTLNYGYADLEPYIDAQTMEIHFSKHHQAYLNNLNNAVGNTLTGSIPLEELLITAEKRGAAVQNNGGGHYNHSLFWNILSPTPKTAPTGNLSVAITEYLHSTDSLKRLMNAEASKRFGSGWVWLYVTPYKTLAVSSTANQDNPIMDAAGNKRGIPILGIDVWEHAYYLKYQNKRGDYLTSIWNVIDWEAVEKNYAEALKSPILKLIEKDNWVELKEFHKVMAQTFHPMQAGKFDPIKTRSKEMADKAKLLKESNIPASFQTDDIKKALKKLAEEAKELDKIISKKAKDDEVRASLNKLHDTFHLIQGLCNH